MAADGHTSALGRHLLIGGPGRAGTSFLVRYLTELGHDTHLARYGEAGWSEEAQAGLEDLPLQAFRGLLPYVVKTPFLHLMLDEVLGEGGPGLDGVIVPVRDLTEAAASRIVTERQHAHRGAPWMAETDATWEVWAQTHGGVVYSLNPIDQGRLLAVGFYTLVERLVRADIPLVLLAFPRMVEDAAYLYERLRPVLPGSVDRAAALAAHARVADTGAVRVGRERQAVPRAQGAANGVCYDDSRVLDAIAMRRELAALRAALAAAEAKLATAEETRSDLAATCDRLREDLACLYRSTAWRLTMPYRLLGSAIKRWLR